MLGGSVTIEGILVKFFFLKVSVQFLFPQGELTHKSSTIAKRMNGLFINRNMLDNIAKYSQLASYNSSFSVVSITAILPITI